MNSAFVPCVATLSGTLASSSFLCRQKDSLATTRRINRSARPHSTGNAKTSIRATAVPLEVSALTFDEEVLQCELPVLVDFYAPWCGPCKLIAPLMDWVAAEYEGQLKVVKVDTEESNEFVKKYGIYGLPTFAVFSKGEPFGVTEGAMGKSSLQKYIADNVPDFKAV